MLRGKHNEILEDSVKKFVDKIVDIADAGWVVHSFPFELNDEMYVYNLEVSKVEFPVWICEGGNHIPKDGCRTIHHQALPMRCKNCNNTDFKEIESAEEMNEWRDQYE